MKMTTMAFMVSLKIMALLINKAGNRHLIGAKVGLLAGKYKNHHGEIMDFKLDPEHGIVFLVAALSIKTKLFIEKDPDALRWYPLRALATPPDDMIDRIGPIDKLMPTECTREQAELLASWIEICPDHNIGKGIRGYWK